MNRIQSLFLLLFFGLFVNNLKSQNLDSLLRANLNSEIDFTITHREIICYDEEFDLLIIRNRVNVNDSNLKNIVNRWNDSLYYPLLKIMRNDTLLDWSANILLYFIYKSNALPLMKYQNNIAIWRNEMKEFELETWFMCKPRYCPFISK